MPGHLTGGRPDCVNGGLVPADCLHVFTAASCRLCSRRPPTVFAAASCADCVHGGLLPTVFTAATSRLCSRRPLVPTVFTAASGRLCSRRQPADCVRGGLLCRLCSRRRLADCVHGGNQPTVIAAASCADCVHGGLWPTVFTAATSRLCSRRLPSNCVRSRRIHADCVHGGSQPTVFAAVSCADCVHGGLLPTVFTAAGRSIDTVVDKFLALMRRLSALWCLLKRDRAVLFLCRSLNVSVFTLVMEWFVFVVKGSKQFKGVFFRSRRAVRGPLCWKHRRLVPGCQPV